MRPPGAVCPGMKATNTSPNNAVLAVLCGVIAVAVMDLSVVNVSLPTIEAELRVSPASLQWVVVTYGIAVAGLLMLGGRLGDLFGHRRLLCGGLAVLVAASALGGFADSLTLLVLARAGQGVGAAFAVPNALGILTRTFAEGPDRTRALGVFGAAGGTAAIGGSIVGGLLVEGPGWPWVFFINVPLGVAIVAAALGSSRPMPEGLRGVAGSISSVPSPSPSASRRWHSESTRAWSTPGCRRRPWCRWRSVPSPSPPSVWPSHG